MAPSLTLVKRILLKPQSPRGFHTLGGSGHSAKPLAAFTFGALVGKHEGRHSSSSSCSVGKKGALGTSLLPPVARKNATCCATPSLRQSAPPVSRAGFGFKARTPRGKMTQSPAQPLLLSGGDNIGNRHSRSVGAHKALRSRLPMVWRGVWAETEASAGEGNPSRSPTRSLDPSLLWRPLIGPQILTPLPSQN